MVEGLGKNLLVLPTFFNQKCIFFKINNTKDLLFLVESIPIKIDISYYYIIRDIKTVMFFS